MNEYLDSKQIAADDIFLPSIRDDDLHKNHTLDITHASVFELQTSGGGKGRDREESIAIYRDF